MRVYAVNSAASLRDKVISAVRSGRFVAVCSGMLANDVPGGLIRQEEIHAWDAVPIGPHALAEFEVMKKLI